MSAKTRSLDPELRPLVDDAGLDPDEGDRIVAILGRQPTRLEIALFGAMWSEHCSYKSSRVHLALLPTAGPTVALGPGENAGAVHLDRGQVAVFKMESHNHPSYIEPFQGAATGVGGILRDVFTMGARPICGLDSLRFGAPDHPKTPSLLRGVVEGIAAYGNCMGVPTVAGETELDPGYDDNILVNAMTVGIARADNIFLGRAEGVGNPVLYVGSRTGRDGLGGATMASASFDDDTEQKKPTVQVGDPFTEKKLLEACMELFETDLVVGIQDMGAAGLTSSSVEMADRAGQGIHLDLDRVPMRAEGMTPYELMLSESQERMLVVGTPGSEDAIGAIFEKWDLSCEPIGVVTDTGRIELFWHGDRVADLPVATLAGTAPKYDRPRRPPRRAPPAPEIAPGAPTEPSEVLAHVLAAPEACSRRPIWQQYDHMVQLRTAVRPGGDAAVLRVPEAGGFVAVTADCDHRAGSLDPFEGGRRTIAEAARNLAVTGAAPLGVTDCLNFGNPRVPEVMWSFRQAILGMREACLAFGAPVVSGNVSFYNETRGRGIPPTPTVGMVGWIPGDRRPIGATVDRPGLDVWLLGPTRGRLDGSLVQQILAGRVGGRLRPIDLSHEVRLGDFLRRLVAEGWLRAAHDVGAGGLAVACAEMLLPPLDEPEGRALGLEGAAFTVGDDALVTLFGEAPGRVLVAADPGVGARIGARARRWGIDATPLGVTGGDRLLLGPIDLDVAELHGRWSDGLERLMSGA